MPHAKPRPDAYTNRIYAWRRHRKLTVRELGERVGVTGNSVSRIERGLSPITIPWLEKVAAALDCTVYDLLFRDPTEAATLFKTWAELPSDRREILQKIADSLAADETPAAAVKK